MAWKMHIQSYGMSPDLGGETGCTESSTNNACLHKILRGHSEYIGCDDDHPIFQGPRKVTILAL